MPVYISDYNHCRMYKYRSALGRSSIVAAKAHVWQPSEAK